MSEWKEGRMTVIDFQMKVLQRKTDFQLRQTFALPHIMTLLM